MKILTDDQHKILTILSRRINPNNIIWREGVEGHWLCLICNKTFAVGVASSFNHGISHLKEKSLLPFI